MRLSP
jgi:putative transposase